MNYYISTQGNDDWSGKLSEPTPDGQDGPFATLEKARDTIRKFKSENELPKGGITVHLRGGDYHREKSFELTKEDSGEKDAPITYRAYQDEKPRLLGAVPLTKWVRLTDPEILKRLDDDVRGKVHVADLPAHGINDFGTLRNRGFGFKPTPAHLELFFDGLPMTLARYPNLGSPPDLGDGKETFIDNTKEPEGSYEELHGWTLIAQGAGKREHLGHREPWYITPIEDGFHYVGTRPSRWETTEDVWVHGFWGLDWANSYVEIDYIDTDRRFIQLKPPYGHIGYQAKQRIFYLNALEELDAPGEYFIDKARGKLYFIPPAAIEGKEILASVLEDTMIITNEASNLQLIGITFEATRGHVLEMNAGINNLVAGCGFHNIGSQAIFIRGGFNHTVQSCDMSELGDGGIDIHAGDRKTLTPCNHVINNNHIRNFTRWSLTYSPALGLYGVGIRATHNLLHDAPHIAVMYLGNEISLEFNRIHHVCQQSGDTGGIYTGRSYTARGNVVRHNYLHDLGGYGGVGSNGMYFDDCVSGQDLVGNIFRNCTHACFIGGGREILVENNIFIDCQPSIQVDARGIDPNPRHWQPMVYKTLKGDLEEFNYLEPPYSEKYPILKEYKKLYESNDGIPPANDHIQHNISFGGTWMNIHWCAKEEHLDINNNLVDIDPKFVDLKNENYNLHKDSPAFEIGFKPIPFDQIGLVKDEYRK